ncbi:hypothetical protein CYMTET_53283 [Cymbomonas tetramitiformis]|uniref:NADP-dependent oxidoreductase domain-containing protein n=1 Tax=Cymbomonas tetramitiformis TaxID=36881 RepID=A0AAE0BIQ6_9CHLO|nr:hypothetical protein CYMTET_53283 [Cymbomonas tetramitiformis]
MTTLDKRTAILATLGIGGAASALYFILNRLRALKRVAFTPEELVEALKNLPLRNTPLKVTDMIAGCSALAGIFQTLAEDVALETVKAALDAGIVDFDTAPHYGLGLSEERTGKGLAKHSGGRQFRLWTKVGRLIKMKSKVTPGDKIEEENVAGSPGCIFPSTPTGVVPVLDYTATGAQQSYNDSRQRLGVPIYGLRVHDCEDEWRLSNTLDSKAGALKGLVGLRRAGTVKAVSLGLNEPNDILRILRTVPAGTIDSVMVAGAWNLLDQNAAELLCECQRRGIKVAFRIEERTIGGEGGGLGYEPGRTGEQRPEAAHESPPRDCLRGPPEPFCCPSLLRRSGVQGEQCIT